MATKVNINGELYARPDVYSITTSGVTNPERNLSYGNLLIIDNGELSTGWSGGSGVQGELKQGRSSIYEFKKIDQMRSHIKGGPLYDAAQALFRPNGNLAGASSVFYLRAAQTTAPKLTIPFDAGDIKLILKDEGEWGNGEVDVNSNELSKGYAVKVQVGSTPASCKLQVYRSTFNGIDPLTSLPYNKELERSRTHLMFESPVFTDISQLVSWSVKSIDFNNILALDPTSVVSGAVINTDITNNTGWMLFTGGTETYNLDFEDILEYIKNVDNTFFLTTSSDPVGTLNSALSEWLKEKGPRYPKYNIIPGGIDKSEFTSVSINTAETFDSASVIVVHGGIEIEDRRTFSKRRPVSMFYKTAMILGRICGLTPQTPLTFKTLDIKSEIHELTEGEIEQAIEKGVLYTNYDYELERFIVGSGINTLQDNEFLVNNDGDSYSISVERIKSQLNKEVIFGAKRRFFSGEEGPNRNTVSPDDIVSWLGTFLTNRTAGDIQDNLILSWRNIEVTVDQDIYYVSYEFVPNFPVEKIVFSGKLMLN